MAEGFDAVAAGDFGALAVLDEAVAEHEAVVDEVLGHAAAVGDSGDFQELDELDVFFLKVEGNHVRCVRRGKGKVFRGIFPRCVEKCHGGGGGGRGGRWLRVRRLRFVARGWLGRERVFY